MIVEPAPAAPRSPRRRWLGFAGLLAPVALLVVVVATALAGPRDAPQGVPPGSGPSAPAGVAIAGPSPSAAPDAAVAVTFPTVAADLAVRSVPDAQAWLDGLTPGPVAVAGWLTGLHPYGACPAAGGDTRGVLGPLCPRRATLDAAPQGPDSARHVHLTIPAGTRLPPELEGAVPLPSMLPIVVVGHIGEKQLPCEAMADDCRSDIVVERVTWANGAAFDPGPVYDAYLEMAPPSMMLRNLDAAENLAIGSFGTILQAALIRPSTVAAVDPVAARALAHSYAPGTLVWYVRGLEVGIDIRDPLHSAGPPRPSWVVVDYRTGATLAHGAERDLRP